MSTSDFLSTSGTNSYLTPTVDMQNLPAWYQNAEQQILGQASTIAGASQPIYQGPQLANFSTDQNSAFQGVDNLQGQTNPAQTQAINNSGQIAQGYNASQAQQYQNPYTQNVVQDINTLGQQTLNQELLPGTAGDFIKAGAFGGSQYGNTQAEVIQKQNQNIAQQQDTALQAAQTASQSNYLQGQQNQNTANTNTGNLTSQYNTENLNNLNAQLNTGNQQQQQVQNADTVAQTNFYNQANYPLEQLGIAQAALRGTTIPTEGQIYTPSNNTGNTAASLSSLLANLQSSGTTAATGGMIPGYAGGGQVKGYATGNSVSNEQPTMADNAQSTDFSQNVGYRARMMLNSLRQLGQPTIPNQQPSAEDPAAVTKNLIQNPIYAPTNNVAPIQQPLAQHVPQAQMVQQQAGLPTGANTPTAPQNAGSSTQQLLQNLAQTVGMGNLRGGALAKGGQVKGYAGGGQTDGTVATTRPISNQEALQQIANLGLTNENSPMPALSPDQAALVPPSVAQNQVDAGSTAQAAATPVQNYNPMSMMGMSPEMMQDRQRMAFQNIQQLGQLGQGAVPAQQAAEAARQQYADTDKQTAQAQLAALVQMKPWLNQPYQGGQSPEVGLAAADAIQSFNPQLAAAERILNGPSAQEMSERNNYQDQLRKLTMQPAATQEQATEADYADKEKALQAAAQDSGNGLGMSSLMNNPLVMLQQKAAIDEQIKAAKASGQDTSQLQSTSDTIGNMLTGKTETAGQKALADNIAKEVADPKGAYQTDVNNYQQILNNHQAATTLLSSIPNDAFSSLRNNSTIDQWMTNTSDPNTQSAIADYKNILAPRLTTIKGNVPLRNLTEFNWANNQLNGLGQSKEGAIAREDYAYQYAKLQSALADQAAQISKQSLQTSNPIDYGTAKNQVFNAFAKANPNTSLFVNGADPSKNGEATVVPSNIVSDDQVNQMIQKTQAALQGNQKAANQGASPQGPSALERLKAKALATQQTQGN